MDAAINEHASVFSRIPHEEACFVKQIAGLGADYEGFANCIGCD